MEFDKKGVIPRLEMEEMASIVSLRNIDRLKKWDDDVAEYLLFDPEDEYKPWHEAAIRKLEWDWVRCKKNTATVRSSS